MAKNAGAANDPEMQSLDLKIKIADLEGFTADPGLSAATGGGN